MIDPQLKRGLLDVCVLTVLHKGDSYGYQIMKDLSACIGISESTLYPILRRLESAGAVNEYSVEHNGRLRKFYHMTELGQKQIRDFLDGWKELAEIYAFILEESGNDEA